MVYIEHLSIQDIRAPGTHLRSCCPTCCSSGPVARTASPPSWPSTYEQSNGDKNTVTGPENRTGAELRGDGGSSVAEQRGGPKCGKRGEEGGKRRRDEAGATSHRLISVPTGSGGHDAHDPC